MLVLCTDSSCIHNIDSGYYNICKLRSNSTPGYGGIDRMYVETCINKELSCCVTDTQRASNPSRG